MLGLTFTVIIMFSIPYLLGSIPFGLLLTKIFTDQNIQNIGSGNIGATNVLRTGSKKLAALTLLLDAGKGAVLIILINNFTNTKPINNSYFGQSLPLLSEDKLLLILLSIGLISIIGHCFPIWLKFKGGKGVATAVGVLLAAVPYAGLAAIITWIALTVTLRISSLSALISAAIAPIVAFFIYGQTPAIICALIALLIWVRHKENIKRILNGTEPKIGGKKNAVQTK